ncbi:uncharacterized protein LOC114279108 isoform X2 [Camellia sinensis]|uniref:uncharacterized protein LOC114279108 isoform X2 n=1 Tax=Camellia sinensis TaxID=4442 RepID=UPI0010363B25|nr:uncharacterized protein LOC114279108 isoform X2 [Camellia sinensis]
MAYRRRQGVARTSTFKEEIHYPPPPDGNSSSSSSLAAQAIRASAAHRDSSSLSSAYADSAFRQKPEEFSTYEYEYASMKSSNKTKGFWGVLAQKAKGILDEEDNVSQQFETPSRMRPQMHDNSTGGQEGRTIMENKTVDIIHETRKLQIRRKGSSSEEQNQVPGVYNPWQQPSVQSTQPQMQTNQETQLKASRDVAMATAAKAKLLLRELKTIKADLAFAKERCSQLEEENKILRDAHDKGVNPADDDMIRLQLETLLAEKARLAHENSVFARENRFLREIVEYHQLTMQDVVYLDEGIEEVTEVYPVCAVSRTLSVSPLSPSSPRSPPESSLSNSPPSRKEMIFDDVPQAETPPSSSSLISTAQHSTRHSNASS